MIAITVEDEEDIQKFKDYTPSSNAGPAAPEEKPAPSPPKEEKVEKVEKVEKPASAPEDKSSKPSSASSEDRVFASPLARKLAEDNSVSFQIVLIKLLCLIAMFLIIFFSLETSGTSLKH